MQAFVKGFDASFGGGVNGPNNDLPSSLALSKTIGLVPDDLRAEDVAEFYKIHNCPKLDSVAGLLNKYGHDLPTLEDVLHQKYGLNQLDCTRTSRLRALATHQLSEFYKSSNQSEKLDRVQETVSKFADKNELPGLIRHIRGKKSVVASSAVDKNKGPVNPETSNTVTAANSANRRQAVQNKNNPRNSTSSAWNRFTGLFAGTKGKGKEHGTQCDNRNSSSMHLGLGFHMKTAAALSRMQFQRRKLNQNLKACDVTATNLRQNYLPQWRQLRDFAVLCAGLSKLNTETTPKPGASEIATEENEAKCSNSGQEVSSLCGKISQRAKRIGRRVRRIEQALHDRQTLYWSDTERQILNAHTPASLDT